MGKRGPAKKPTELKIIQGNPGKHKLNNDVKYEAENEIPKPLVHLDRVAKAEWKRLAPIVFKAKMLTKADIAAFGAYCAAYSAWYFSERALRAKLSENGGMITYETDKGYQQQIPEISVANTARLNMVKLAREFGLTPSARAGIDIKPPEEQENSIMEFIRGVK